MKKIAACADSTRTCSVFGPEPQLLADPARANPAFPLPPERAARPLACLAGGIYLARQSQDERGGAQAGRICDVLAGAEDVKPAFSRFPARVSWA